MGFVGVFKCVRLIVKYFIIWIYGKENVKCCVCEKEEILLK